MKIVPSVSPSNIQKICLACGQENVKNRCGGCKKVYFCDRNCQKRCWNEHRSVCLLEKEKTPNDSSSSNKSVHIIPQPTKIIEIPSRIESVQDIEMNSSAPKPNRSNPVDANDPASHIRNTASKPTRSAAVDANDSSSHISDINPKPTRSNAVDANDPASHISDINPKPTRSNAIDVNDPASHISDIDTKPTRSNAVDANDPVSPIDPRVSPTSNTQKKSTSSKRKKNKKKGRSQSVHERKPTKQPQKTRRSVSDCGHKHVMWGKVSAREFTRFPGGGSAIPYDGTWALGLGDPIQDTEIGSVLEVEEHRVHALNQRASELNKKQKKNVREGETRQFDYQRGVDNPLFSRLSERQRKEVLTKSIQTDKRQKLKDDNLQMPDFACVSSEQLDEFAKIRVSREDECGCSCGDLVKKVSKMNIKRLHAFLSDRDIEITTHSKTDLLFIAKSIALTEKNCSTARDCECVRNGIGCHANACEGCRNDCANPNQSYHYEKEAVVKYRKKQIENWRKSLDSNQLACA